MYRDTVELKRFIFLGNICCLGFTKISRCRIHLSNLANVWRVYAFSQKPCVLNFELGKLPPFCLYFNQSYLDDIISLVIFVLQLLISLVDLKFYYGRIILKEMHTIDRNKKDTQIFTHSWKYKKCLPFRKLYLPDCQQCMYYVCVYIYMYIYIYIIYIYIIYIGVYVYMYIYI